MVAYYDLVLGLIPVTLFGFSGALYGAGLAATTAVLLGALVAAGFVGHAMFVRAPIDGDRSATQSAPAPAAD